MGEVSKELSLLAIGGRQSAGHAVEGPAKRCEWLWPPASHPNRKIARCNALGSRHRSVHPAARLSICCTVGSNDTAEYDEQYGQSDEDVLDRRIER
jgi:hypothetical protein